MEEVSFKVGLALKSAKYSPKLNEELKDTIKAIPDGELKPKTPPQKFQQMTAL